ncbi:MAG: glucosamine-6-phosphate deaminase [Sporolactobacillus sp.]
MKVIAVKDYQAMSVAAAQAVCSVVRANPGSALGLATGSSPLGMYQALAAMCKKKAISFRKVRTVNLDEYIGVPETDVHSYHYYMNKRLFSALDVVPKNCHLPNGMASQLDDECKRYDRLITELGGIDLQLLGIGQNGHIGFNEPGSPLDSGTHVVTLTASTRHANARFFSSIEDVPRQAITVGLATILKSREIMLLVSGAAKAETLARLLHMDCVDAGFPASALLKHPRVTLIADQAALAKAGAVVNHG